MKKYRAVVIGDYAKGEPVYSGQTAKVRDYYNFLLGKFDEEQIQLLDTRGWQKHPIRLMRELVRLCKQSENVVLLLCTNGLSIKFLYPRIVRMKKKYGFRLLFSVVGGSLLTEYDRLKYVQKHLKDAEAVYVETRKLESMLTEKDHDNIHYAPVFSRRKTVRKEEIMTEFSEPLRLCTYSRVCKEKGISDAIDAVVEVNRRLGRQACVLDVYGPPTAEYKEEFETKTANADGAVINQPLLTDANAIDELSKHYLMVFPTYYNGEGFPIALIECMKSGLPVVATDWHFNAEIIDDGKSGFIYDRDSTSLADVLEPLIRDTESNRQMREYCVEKSYAYEPEEILRDLYERVAK